MRPEDTDRWQAVYRDETIIDEEDITEIPISEDDQHGIGAIYTWDFDTGHDVRLPRKSVRRRGWAEVDAAQVHAIQIRVGADVVMAVVIPEGATPVLFRRRAIATDVSGTEPMESGYMTLTVIGWNWPNGGACWLWRGVDGGVVMTAGDVRE